MNRSEQILKQDELLRIAYRMRVKQKLFFKTKDKVALSESVTLERSFDEKMDEYIAFKNSKR